GRLGGERRRQRLVRQSEFPLSLQRLRQFRPRARFVGTQSHGGRQVVPGQVATSLPAELPQHSRRQPASIARVAVEGSPAVGGPYYLGGEVLRRIDLERDHRIGQRLIVPQQPAVILTDPLQFDHLGQIAEFGIQGPLQALQLARRQVPLGGDPSRQPPQEGTLSQLGVLQQRTHQPLRLGKLPRLAQELLRRRCQYQFLLFVGDSVQGDGQQVNGQRHIVHLATLPRQRQHGEPLLPL